MLSLSVRNIYTYVSILNFVCTCMYTCTRRFFIYLFIHLFILDIKIFSLSCHVRRNWRL